ncbi:unnamed protein product [Callosobruchus maculatus]|uniref:Endonuclease/exonuclease/phosphatase domain-containing protein n=1 Tax=Callosobruchus maculatus TaxID=64391 RepID=A0A653BYY1_CALMS|nr:unnamed protein product [Callosobruchus maculatus]
MSRQISLGYWNAESIKTDTRFGKIKRFLKQKNPDIVAITETWLTKEETDDKKELDGYKLIRKDRNHAVAEITWLEKRVQTDRRK